MRRVLVSASVLTALTSCVAPPAPPPPPAPVAPPAPPPPLPSPPPSSDWRDWPLTAGEWRYRPAARAASFGTPGQARLTMTCDRAAGTIALGALEGDAATIRTSSSTRTLRPAGGIVTLPARDPLLDALAFSRGRFVIERPGAAPLVVPAQAEIGRVIEDCRG